MIDEDPPTEDGNASSFPMLLTLAITGGLAVGGILALGDTGLASVKRFFPFVRALYPSDQWAPPGTQPGDSAEEAAYANCRGAEAITAFFRGSSGADTDAECRAQSEGAYWHDPAAPRFGAAE